MKSEFEQFINLKIESKQIGHAYLVEVEENYNDTLVNIIKKLLLTENCSLSDREIEDMVDNDIHPDVIKVYPDGQWIKKEQIMKLQENLSTKSVYNGRRIYIIDKAELMNKSANNSLLKFLEEPADDIVGILITRSKNGVLGTIKSRCQVFSVKNDEKRPLDDKIINYIEQLTNDKKCDYIEFLQIFGQLEKKELTMLLIEILSGYEHLFMDDQNLCNSQVSIDTVLRHMKALASGIEILKYNLNLRLMVDNLYYEMFEVV